jgi:phenylalanyl-tRNA synthetase alpha chain
MMQPPSASSANRPRQSSRLLDAAYGAMESLTELTGRALAQIDASADLARLDEVRVQWLGKKGLLTEQLKSLGALSAAERPAAGQKINEAKEVVQGALDARRTVLAEVDVQRKLESGRVDITLEGRGEHSGGLHPVTLARLHIERLFREVGFTVADGPEIEDDFHNFTALNVPANHPARAMHDTFYLDKAGAAEALLLRTHTSPVQIRALRAARNNLPLAVVAPGRVYRMDSDATHTPMFHQIEGLLVDVDVSFANLKSILHGFMEAFFERDLAMRLRPSYFPFTEPSAEVDITCVECNGGGCRLCKNSGWIEVLGCGMVHPNVLKACDVDAERYTAYAFGMGIDRLAMLKYGVNDLRLFFENDLRFLRQFRGGP